MRRSTVAVEGIVDRPDRRGLADGLRSWLFSGALNHPDGAVAAWRDRASGQLAYRYAEITGYYLTAATFVHLPDEPNVRRAADWLSDRVERGELESRRHERRVVYNFDSAVIASGLLSLGRVLGSERYLDAGIRLALRLGDQILALGGLPSLDPASMLPRRPATWSTVGRLHLLKAIQPLCAAAAHGADGTAEAAAVLADEARHRFSLDGGDLRGPEGDLYLHPACYAIEGLWIWSAVQGDGDYLDLVRDAVDEILTLQLPSGGFPRSAGEAVGEQTDVLAQVTRLALLVGRDAGAERGLERLAELALPAAPGMALPYAPQAAEQHESSWSSMFALQALELASTRSSLDWRLLI